MKQTFRRGELTKQKLQYRFPMELLLLEQFHLILQVCIYLLSVF